MYRTYGFYSTNANIKNYHIISFNSVESNFKPHSWLMRNCIPIWTAILLPHIPWLSCGVWWIKMGVKDLAQSSWKAFLASSFGKLSIVYVSIILWNLRTLFCSVGSEHFKNLVHLIYMTDPLRPVTFSSGTINASCVPVPFKPKILH